MLFQRRSQETLNAQGERSPASHLLGAHSPLQIAAIPCLGKPSGHAFHGHT